MPAARFRAWPLCAGVLGWNSFDEVSAFVLQMLTDSGVKRVDFRCQNGAEKLSKTIKIGEQGRTNQEKGGRVH